MFTEVQIENYKSIQSLKIGLGRVNVFIGENGCGKSNILEAIALAGAAAGNKLDNEFLAPRGIRVTEPEFMRSAFDKESISKEIKVNLKRDEKILLKYVIQHDNQDYSNWNNLERLEQYEQVPDILKEPVRELFMDFLFQYTKKIIEISPEVSLLNSFSPKEISLSSDENINQLMTNLVYGLDLKNFLIYSPENSSLRIFEQEGQIQPLGISGQGLFKLIKVLNNSSDKINEIKQRLELIDWFDDFKLPSSDLERVIQIKDRYLDDDLPYFNQRSSNEGFLFLMFYFALFVSDNTPEFFAIDNIENALNPKLCTRLIKELVELAKKYDKQVIFTTHNPAVLDGLDLNDDDQRLFVIYRNIDGHTKARRISAPEPLEDDDPVQLSEAFINGYLGGLPKNF
ncbi:AAA family ATPase [Pseudanabaena sp. UWO311]|uniref:AAA family ATPase n=1 Tax=Pseudanabaena sp. UWO311 TaxID=2487337 RepID=UPI00115A53AB|nr:AAA family ATPase [Pseudanabaena sp. UWO311]TYQ27020.1 AAA family ATPase [Pseudanabaena sp. UWO311]